MLTAIRYPSQTLELTERETHEDPIRPVRQRLARTRPGSTDMDERRAMHVQHIREQVACGHYEVDTRKVASAIVERLLAARPDDAARRA